MKYKLYEKTAARLAKAGAKDPTAMIVALAEEIEHYRAKIHGLETMLHGLPPDDKNQDAQLTAALKLVAQEYEKGTKNKYVIDPVLFALHNAWEIWQSMETRL